MDFLNDFYYVGEHVFISACNDYEAQKVRMNSSAKLLFFSLGLRKKFDKNICFCPYEILNRVSSKLDELKEKAAILKESVQEDTFSHDTENLDHTLLKNKRLKELFGENTPVYCILVCATIKAGDCIGKVKIVTHKDNIEILNDIIKRLDLPLIAISDEQACKELEAIHSKFLQQREDNLKKTE